MGLCEREIGVEEVIQRQPIMTDCRNKPNLNQVVPVSPDSKSNTRLY
jgi:hypothetical protein